MQLVDTKNEYKIATVRLQGTPDLEDLTGMTRFIMGIDPTYETVVRSEKINHPGWITIESYKTEEDAKEGHERWLEEFEGTGMPGLLEKIYGR